jgi:hypothetical protein
MEKGVVFSEAIIDDVQLIESLIAALYKIIAIPADMDFVDTAMFMMRSAFYTVSLDELNSGVQGDGDRITIMDDLYWEDGKFYLDGKKIKDWTIESNDYESIYRAMKAIVIEVIDLTVRTNPIQNRFDNAGNYVPAATEACELLVRRLKAFFVTFNVKFVV